MSMVYMNIMMAFTVSLVGLLMYRSHLMSSVLSLFVMAALTILNSHFTLASTMPIILLVFAACEAALGLSLLVMVSNTYGTMYKTLTYFNAKMYHSNNYTYAPNLIIKKQHNLGQLHST